MAALKKTHFSLSSMNSKWCRLPGWTIWCKSSFYVICRMLLNTACQYQFRLADVRLIKASKLLRANAGVQAHVRVLNKAWLPSPLKSGFVTSHFSNSQFCCFCERALLFTSRTASVYIFNYPRVYRISLCCLSPQTAALVAISFFCKNNIRIPGPVNYPVFIENATTEC